MRSCYRLIPVVLFLIIAACSTVTAPTPTPTSSLKPAGIGRDIVDTTCRSGWNASQGRAC